jgi:hypothetical protein
MKPQTTLTKLLSALALAVVFSVFSAPSALAGPQPHLKTGMFGVARGQIARINACHIGDPGLRPIDVEMLFLDATGAVVARDNQALPPGPCVVFDLPFDAGRADNRMELRVIVDASRPPNPNTNLRISVEVFDADTGKNTVYIGDPNL